MSKYVYSSSPQVKSPRTTKRIMIDVCIALLPACIAGCVLLGMVNPSYGWKSALIIAIASLSAVVAEFVYLLCCKKSFKTILSQFDFSSLVTGMLIGMNMYATSKWYVAILASVFAVVVVKMLFGGTGKNIVNPAIAGRIFAFISFGAAMGGEYISGSDFYVSEISGGTIKGATPLASLFAEDYFKFVEHNSLSNLDLFIGTGVPGAIGEISKIALIAGGIYLVVRGVLNFRWPLVYVVTTGVVTVIISAINGLVLDFGGAMDIFLTSILSGGLMLGAIFMATDYVTTPNTKLGNYIYFVLLGVLTAVLRQATGGEVVSFAILLMNLLVPLFDMYIRRRPFGYVKPAKAQKEGK